MVAEVNKGLELLEDDDVVEQKAAMSKLRRVAIQAT
jgi:hypothetical protein